MYLDSNDLSDLSTLFSEGIHKSEVIILVRVHSLPAAPCSLPGQAVSEDIATATKRRSRIFYYFDLSDYNHTLLNQFHVFPGEKASEKRWFRCCF